jgi:hypothetical protein
VAEPRRIERLYRLTSDDLAVYDRWNRLVDEHQVSGRQAFDSRLVAVMLVAEIDAIVTFNRADFTRYRITVIDPVSTDRHHPALITSLAAISDQALRLLRYRPQLSSASRCSG